ADEVGSRRLGALAAACGLAGLIGTGWLWAITATDLDAPEWLRVLGAWLMPVGILGGLIVGIPTARGPGRPAAVVGIVLAGLALVGAVVLFASWDY
ncbi:hypothetical protein NWP09_11915, partial [Agrococcus sp. HG114]|nr:hypothetical protein [Agrococcus sp. HG114]